MCVTAGVNSGVMLMNLTRMRDVNWVDKMEKYYEEYKMRITWGDQDLVNVFFHFHPGGYLAPPSSNSPVVPTDFARRKVFRWG